MSGFDNAKPIAIGFANATTDTTVRRVDPAVEALRSLVRVLEANQRALVKRIEDLEQRKP
jgi:hypothetical protein